MLLLFYYLCTKSIFVASFIKLWLIFWCHMDYYTDVLYYVSGNIAVALLSMEGQRALRFDPKYLNLCSEDERRSYRFGTTWGWVINDRIVIFGELTLYPWAKPLWKHCIISWRRINEHSDALISETHLVTFIKYILQNIFFCVIEKKERHTVL